MTSSQTPGLAGILSKVGRDSVEPSKDPTLRSSQGSTESRPTSRWQRRLYQTTALVAARKVRILGLFWTRRGRKSTTLGDIAFEELSRGPGRTVIAASASLVLGTELASMTVNATERALIVGREAAAFQAALEHAHAEQAQGLNLTVANSETGRTYSGLSGEEFADLYQSSKLEMRLNYDRTAYSRVRVIAPNPATARGWGGTVLRDEVGFIKNEAEVQAATRPIIDTDPSFRLIYASNLPNDDRHPWFEMTLPRDPALEFPFKPEGHFYRGQSGLMIHRVALGDAYAAGHTLYNEGGDPQPYAAAVANLKPSERRCNYELIHEFGGAAAIDALALHTSQQRGASQCLFVFVRSEDDVQRGIRFLLDNLGDGAVGLGFDTATTTKEISNPSSVTVTEQRGSEKLQRLVICWKERNPKIARSRVRQIIEAVQLRKAGGPAKRLCIDASNERYFAEETADELRALIPVEMVINGTSIHPPGYEEPTNFKTWLGDLYATEVNDNKYSLPADEYFKDDHRLPVKDRGTYTCAVEPDGKHGDTFDSGKLAQYALMERGSLWSSLV